MKKNVETPLANRLACFDNLRSLMVIFVLIFHAGASYGSAVAFWPFHDVNPSMIIDLCMFLGDVFMMAVLFFIAGYFALPSLQKKGGWRFIMDKLKHLGIPWLVVTSLVLPVLDYIHYSAHSFKNGVVTRGYAAHWLLSMKKIAELSVGWMEMSAYQNMTEHFYQRYMWFLSLLLLFFGVFALLYGANKKWGRRTEQASIEDRTRSKRSVFAALMLVGVLTVLLFASVKFFISPGFIGMGWFSLGNLIQFQFGKLVIYGSYFGLGIYAYSRKWFLNGLDFGRSWVWWGICLILFVVNMLVLKNLSAADIPSLGLRLAFVVLYPIWMLTFLGAFTAFAARHWNRSTPFSRELAANSYNMYLTHYVFPMTLPLLLSAWEGGPVLIKFGIVAFITVLLSYGISRYIIRSFPRQVIIGLICLSVLLAVTT